ncbi:hypothetical protein [Paraflavitalea speifideaquila]|uniref:hypothetical protein n=1 Tax=Paraflavitalea speifideaquila TaxID=3076558 RepID=UPI0028E940FA|nr:hypothetical protein [Paraflavitalea speifideiaquila]
MVIQTPSMLFRTGETLINRTVYANSKFIFSRSAMGTIVNNTGRFPEGDLEYCYEVNIGESKNAALPEVFENCFNHFNQPFTPLLLVNPIDGDEICNTRPQFIWQPLHRFLLPCVSG